MGVHREFNFEEDIELLNLKYQVNGNHFSNYFENEMGAGEQIQDLTKGNTENKF